MSIVASQILYPEIVIRSTVSIASNLVYSASYLNSLIKHDTHLQNLLNLNDIIEEKQKQNTSKTLGICLENLGQILKELEQNIDSVIYKIENHKHLWFNSIRSYNITNESKNIPMLLEKMNHRFEIVIKISSVI